MVIFRGQITGAHLSFQTNPKVSLSPLCLEDFPFLPILEIFGMRDLDQLCPKHWGKQAFHSFFLARFLFCSLTFVLSKSPSDEFRCGLGGRGTGRAEEEVVRSTLV